MRNALLNYWERKVLKLNNLKKFLKLFEKIIYWNIPKSRRERVF